MYRALESFTTKDYDIRRKQILEDDFTTQDQINEFLTIGYIEEYDGTIEITENGEYDVKDYENADVNVSGGSDIVVVPDGMKLGYSKFTEFPQLDTSNVTDMNYFFVSNNQLIEAPYMNTENVTNMGNMFENCTRLTKIPQYNTTKVQKMSFMFRFCSALTTIPVLNTSGINAYDGLNNTFYNCSSLSDESLNNILQMCINATGITSAGYKSLRQIGLTSAQATRCQSLSDYQAFLNAGWTTGY